MRRLLLGAALTVMAASALAQTPSYIWHLPPGVIPPPVPADNPMSDAKVALGRRLFYDADLSLDGTISCGTCHEQHRAFTEGNASHPGVGGVPGRRNVMALANAAYFTPLTWADPTQHGLEQQMLVPLQGTHPVEMGMAGKDAELAKRLSADPCYQQMFAAAFPDTGGRIDVAAVGKALASFERTLISYDAPYDRFRRGDKTAMSDTAQRGLKLFTVRHCETCHAEPDFTDLKFHNIGLYDEDGAGAYPARDHGLIEVTQRAGDEGRVRTPSLRNVALTGPYMHDGSVKSLADAIRRHLDGDAAASPLRDGALKGVSASDADINDLVGFLQSLTDSGFVTNPDFALPKLVCGKPNY
jgi:cytochrome c peroxidase